MAGSTTPGQRPAQRLWLVQISVGISTLITTMDTSSINVAINAVANEFAVDVSSTSWLSLIAFLVVTSTLLLFGRLSDMLGSKRVFLSGFVVYGASSLLAGLAPTFVVLLLFRALQALGVSILSANALAILTESYPPHRRGFAVGVFSAIVGLGYFLGPMLAGTLITCAGWRFVFFGLAPLAVIGFFVNLAVLPHFEPVQRGRFDFVGAFLFAVSVTGLLLAVSFARSNGLQHPTVLLAAAIAILFLVLFVRQEFRFESPMLAPSLFSNRLFTLSLVSAFLLFLGITGQELLIPIFVQRIMGQEASVAGVLLAIVPLLRMVLATVTGELSDRFGSQRLTVSGAAMTAAGLFGLAVMNEGVSLFYIAACLFVIGVGQGVFFSPNMHAIMTSVPAGMAGIASGAMGIRRNLGQSLGVALTAYALQTGSGSTEVNVAGFQAAFTLTAVAVGLSTVLSMLGGSTPISRKR